MRTSKARKQFGGYFYIVADEVHSHLGGIVSFTGANAHRTDTQDRGEADPGGVHPGLLPLHLLLQAQFFTITF